MAIVVFCRSWDRGGKGGNASTVAELEHIRNLLEKFHSIYNVYPPADGVEWIDTSKGAKPSNWGIIVRVARQAGHDLTASQIGLAYYLKSDEWAEDYAEHRSGLLKEHLDQITTTSRIERTVLSLSAIGHEGGEIVYSNAVWSCNDSWGNPYHYQCVKPYQSYQLWSKGPDGKTDPKDHKASVNDDDVGHAGS